MLACSSCQWQMQSEWSVFAMECIAPLQGNWCVAVGVEDMEVEGTIQANDIIVSSQVCPSKGCKADPYDPNSLRRAVAVATAGKPKAGSGPVKALVLFGLNAAYPLKAYGSAALTSCLEDLSQDCVQTDAHLKVCASLLQKFLPADF